MDDPNGPVDELCKPIGASLPPAACNANLCCCDCCFLKALVPRPGGGLACSCLGSAYSGIYVFSSLIAGDMVSGTTYTPTQLPFNAGTGCTDIATGSNCTLCGGGCPCAGVQCSARQVQYLPRECIRIRCSVSCPDSDPCP
ncbi:MAG: hypothetical protein JXD21_01980 [Candidatus Omnitrophica bacterium]|nr:hypothetical protein [Candidatus Omnitrophota bacterium]